MNFEESFDRAITHPDFLATLDGTGVNPLPAYAAEPSFKDDIKTTYNLIRSFPESIKKSPYWMNQAYREYLDMNTVLLSNTHPLLSVGKDRIAAWKKALDEYEALYNGEYPLVTTVTKESAHLVEHLIPEEYLDQIDDGNRIILAAMRYIPSEEELSSCSDFRRKIMAATLDGKEDSIDYNDFVPPKTTGGVVPAGVISFVLTSDGDDPLVKIEWLYVAPIHRNRRMADILITQMFSMLSDYHPAAYVADIDREYLSGDGEKRMYCDPDEAPIYQEFGIQVEDEDYDPEKDFAPLVHFLTKWRFVMQSIEDVTVPAVLMEPMDDITTEEWDEFVGSLQEMSFEDMQNMTREVVTEVMYA